MKNQELSSVDKNGEGIKMCPYTDGRKSMWPIWLIILFIIAWSVLLYYYPPETIVELLGVNNVYLFVFILAMIGGVSTFTSTTFYATLITIALGDISTVQVALFASIGLTLGDILFYYLGTKSRQCIRGRYAGHVLRLIRMMEHTGERVIMVLIFFYSLTPLPSDIIAIALAIVGFPFRKMVVPLLVGNFTLIVILVELSQLGYGLI